VDVGALHVGAACVALALGVSVLVRRKGDASHVALGRLYLAAMLAVNLPVFFLYDATGGPGPFHVLALVSVMTTALGWLIVKRGRTPRALEAHAALMTWSWLGVATAGLAQAANQHWPAQSPWPVLAVVSVVTVVGLVSVPRYVSRQLRRRSSLLPPPTAQ
jgi:uncharacterized membrane protein